MARTTSISFPNMIDVSSNKVAVIEDNASIVNRTRLLFMSNPTEMFNDPEFGLGLKRYLWQYNTPNVKANIQDNMKAQLALYEPQVDHEKTSFADGLLYTGREDDNIHQQFNELKMTVGLSTIYGDSLEVKLNSDK